MNLFESYLNFKKKDETLYVIPVRTHTTSVPNSRPHDIFYKVLYDKENAKIIDYTVIKPAFSLANASDKILDRVVIKSLKEEDVTDSDKVFMMRFFYFSATGTVPNTYDVFETAYAYNEQSKLAQYLPFKLVAQRSYESRIMETLACSLRKPLLWSLKIIVSFITLMMEKKNMVRQTSL